MPFRTLQEVYPSELGRLMADVLAPSQLLHGVAEADMAHQRLARQDPNAFMSYVLKDEETGLPILQARTHVEWQQLAGIYDRLLIWSHYEAGKTIQLAVGRSLYELMCNRNLRIVICSNTHGQAAKTCMTIGRYIEQSEEYHRVAPNVERAPGLPWNKAALTVKRDTYAKDPTVQVTGLHGNILGSRIDLLILDDILDYENTLRESQREDLWAWYHSTLETRLTKEARVLCIGTAWHRDDVMHRFARTARWKAFRYPAVDDEGRSTWPERWPEERIEKARQTLGPVEAARQLDCRARSDESSTFKLEWIQKCKERGDGRDLTYALTSIPPGYKVFTGVDLGVRDKRDSALTCLFTIVVHPDETREVLWIESGRWGGPEIVDRIIDTHRRYQGIIYVENNAAQEFILQFTRARSAVPVRPFTTTGQAQRHPEFGLESIAAEMAGAKWIIPNHGGVCHAEVDAWIGELLYYDPKGHPGDRLMGSWFAREGANVRKRRVHRRRLDLMTR